jgi:ssDNA-binding replication factor A large subunit
LLTKATKGWQIKARITHKDTPVTYQSKNGEQKLFKIKIIDDSSEIQATFFNDGYDKFYSRITEGSVYIFSGGQIKDCNPKYNKTKNNLEIIFDKSS